MEKFKLVASLALCCLPLWILSALSDYGLNSFFDQGRTSPRHLTGWGAIEDSFGLYLGTVLFWSWYALRAQKSKSSE